MKKKEKGKSLINHEMAFRSANLGNIINNAGEDKKTMIRNSSNIIPINNYNILIKEAIVRSSDDHYSKNDQEDKKFKEKVETPKRITPEPNGRNSRISALKEVFFDTNKYNSYNYNIFSERYDSDYVEKDFKTRVFPINIIFVKK